jgi:hypothetical protein
LEKKKRLPKVTGSDCGKLQSWWRQHLGLRRRFTIRNFIVRRSLALRILKVVSVSGKPLARYNLQVPVSCSPRERKDRKIAITPKSWILLLFLYLAAENEDSKPQPSCLDMVSPIHLDASISILKLMALIGQ